MVTIVSLNKGMCVIELAQRYMDMYIYIELEHQPQSAFEPLRGCDKGILLQVIIKNQQVHIGNQYETTYGFMDPKSCVNMRLICSM